MEVVTRQSRKSQQTQKGSNQRTRSIQLFLQSEKPFDKDLKGDQSSQRDRKFQFSQMVSERENNLNNHALNEQTPSKVKPSLTASALQIKTNSTFDQFTHKPPRIDHKGYNKETHKGKELFNKHKKNALTESVSIPQWWNNQRNQDQFLNSQSSQFQGVTEKMTRTKLLEQRKKDMIPDISYDIDGDGFVGGRDYVIARKFDQENKQFLTSQEKEKLHQALQNGYENKYVWNVEASGNQRPYRILQKRGVIVDADDYLPVTSTYPQHPLSQIKPQCSTYTELKAFRANIEKQDIGLKKSKQDDQVAHLQKVQFKDYYQPQEFVANPKYSATWQKVAEKRKKDRAHFGLNPENIDINTEKLPDPSIKWIKNNQIPSKSLMIEKRKQDDLKELMKFEKKFEGHVNGQERIEDRENCIARLTFKGLENVTMNKQMLKQKRTLEMIEDMTNKFGNQVLGVHGAELPKFQGHQDDQFYWTYQKSYKKSPRCQSLNLFKQNIKYWAKNDQMKLSDTIGDNGPVDPFKMENVRKISNAEIPLKPNNESYWLPSDQIGDPEFKNKWLPIVKWSQQEASFKCQGLDRFRRTFELIVDHAKETEKNNIEKEKQMEEVIIKQAPRMLQNELAQQIYAQKQFEASLVIGNKLKNQNKGNLSNRQGNNQKSNSKMVSNNDNNKNEKDKTTLISQGQSPRIFQKGKDSGIVGNIINNQAKSGNLLIQRIQNANQMDKKEGPGNFGNTMMSTMAGTGIPGGGQSSGSIPSMINESTIKHGQFSSPFKESIARGMLTGVGLFGK